VSSTPYWLDEDARPATEPLAEQLFPRPHYARRGFDYWQQLPDGRLIAGGRRNTTLEAENTAVEETTEVIQVQIEELVRELLGRLPRITIGGRDSSARRRTGYRSSVRFPAVTASGSPPATPATATSWASPAELVAQAILGRPAPELELFDPARLIPS
jgi:hypothetical protein